MLEQPFAISGAVGRNYRHPDAGRLPWQCRTSTRQDQQTARRAGRSASRSVSRKEVVNLNPSFRAVTVSGSGCLSPERCATRWTGNCAERKQALIPVIRKLEQSLRSQSQVLDVGVIQRPRFVDIALDMVGLTCCQAADGIRGRKVLGHCRFLGKTSG